MLPVVLLVTMCALARASSSIKLGPTYHPAHTEIRDELCYVAGNEPDETPSVSVFAQLKGKWRRRSPSDSPGEYYCDESAPKKVNGEGVSCAYDGAVVTLSTTSVGDENVAVEHQVHCTFNIDIVEECPVVVDTGDDSSDSSDGSDGSDHYGHGRDWRFGGRFWVWKKWSWHNKASSPSGWSHQHKRQDDFVPCETRTSIGGCLQSCDPTDPTDGNCQCLFDLPLGGELDENGNCPEGVQCCWNIPCIAHSGSIGGTAEQCILRGGGEVTDTGLVPNNCEFTDAGVCQCAEPKTETSDPSTAPFDCDCNTLTPEEWLMQGAQGTCPAFNGGGDTDTEPNDDADQALAVGKVALRVALHVGHRNVIQFLASCDVEILRVEGSETSRICEKIFRAFDRNQVRAYRRATKKGCDFVLHPGHAPAARLVAEDSLTSEDIAALDTFTVVTAVDDSAASLAAATATGVAVAVGAATL